MFSETEMDDTFPAQRSYSAPFRRDRTSQGGGIVLYVKEDILYKMIKGETNLTLDLKKLHIQDRVFKEILSDEFCEIQNLLQKF